MFTQLCKQHFPIILFWQPIFKSKTYNHAVTFAWLDNLENILNAIVERQICKLFEVRTLLTLLAELYNSLLYVWGITSYLFFFFFLKQARPFLSFRSGISFIYNNGSVWYIKLSSSKGNPINIVRFNLVS